MGATAFLHDQPSGQLQGGLAGGPSAREMQRRAAWGQDPQADSPEGGRTLTVPG